MPSFFQKKTLVWSVFGTLVVGAGFSAWSLTRAVRQALAKTKSNTAPIAFQPVPEQAFPVQQWSNGEVKAVGLTPSGLLCAGAFGVEGGLGLPGAQGRQVLQSIKGLPGLDVPALAIWRERPVAGPASGGLYLHSGRCWEEARTGFGNLHVRALVEGPGGELYIGAKEGLFRTLWRSKVIEKLDRFPVRTLTLGSGMLIAGGEEGLYQVEPNGSKLIQTDDPWIDWAALRGRELWVLTARGLAKGNVGSGLALVNQEATSAAMADGSLYAVCGKRLFKADGGFREEFCPAAPERVFSSLGALFVDTPRGLYQREKGQFHLVRPRQGGFPGTSSHVNALAEFNGKLAVGFFDGGVAFLDEKGVWTPLPGEDLWGVNAMAVSGGELHIASLRGAWRTDGRRLTRIEGLGGAYALGQTQEGLAIGYGQGLLLPGARMISAFHGLPGNQVLALCTRDDGQITYVGTPSGLGALRGRKVHWRTTTGDGKLPHPWVTSLARWKGKLFIGTYGGGVAALGEGQEGPGVFSHFMETTGFKINPGCLVEAGGRLLLGAEGKGLFWLRRDGSGFDALAVPLPSLSVTSLLALGQWLYIGTDKGLVRHSLNSFDNASSGLHHSLFDQGESA